MSLTIRLAGKGPVRRWLVAILAMGTAALVISGGVTGTPVASAAPTTVGLGTATPFAVLGGQTVTNTGPSVISGSLGVDPGTAIVGFPPGLVIKGTQYSTDPVASQAQSDLTTAYLDAAGRTPTSTFVAGDNQLGGQTLTAGVYAFGGASTANLTGPLTLDAQGDANAVFIFQASSTLVTASNSVVLLVNGAQACNVFWQVTSSATLGSGTTFVGSILALTSATLDTGANVLGRVLARNGAVTLDTNTITQSNCLTPPPTTTTTTTGGGSSTTTTTGTTTTGTGTTGTGTTGTGSSGGAAGNGLGTGAIVPSGFPRTGAGGASHSNDPTLVAFGGLAVVGALAAMGQAIRRRRVLPAGDGHADDQS